MLGAFSTEAHSKFRRSKKWKTFHDYMIERHPYCAFCGSNKATRTVHHTHICQTEDEYEDLSEDRFIVLCSQCHSFLHWIGRKKSTSPYVLAIKNIALKIGFGSDWIKTY